MIGEAEQARLLANTESMSEETSDSNDYSDDNVEDESQWNEELLHTHNDTVYVTRGKNVAAWIPDANKEDQRFSLG